MTSWDDENVLYPDYDGIYSTACICQNSKCSLKGWILLNVNYMLISLTLYHCRRKKKKLSRGGDKNDACGNRLELEPSVWIHVCLIAIEMVTCRNIYICV